MRRRSGTDPPSEQDNFDAWRARPPLYDGSWGLWWKSMLCMWSQFHVGYRLARDRTASCSGERGIREQRSPTTVPDLPQSSITSQALLVRLATGFDTRNWLEE